MVNGRYKGWVNGEKNSSLTSRKYLDEPTLVRSVFCWFCWCVSATLFARFCHLYGRFWPDVLIPPKVKMKVFICLAVLAVIHALPGSDSEIKAKFDGKLFSFQWSEIVFKIEYQHLFFIDLPHRFFLSNQVSHLFQRFFSGMGWSWVRNSTPSDWNSSPSTSRRPMRKRKMTRLFVFFSFVCLLAPSSFS